MSAKATGRIVEKRMAVDGQRLVGGGGLEGESWVGWSLTEREGVWPLSYIRQARDGRGIGSTE
jgi:hypothetical protein